MSTAAAATTRVDSVLQQVELELWRDNIDGALGLLARANALTPDHRYAARAEEIRSWLLHLKTDEAYAAAYEDYYRRSKRRLDLKRLERDVRILLGRKTRKTVRRVAEYPEYQLLEREVIERRPENVLDAGCGEGRIALGLGHRFPSIGITAVEVSDTNVGIARRLNRFRNVTFRQGMVEDVIARMPPASFDLVYSFAVLEHVRDVATTVAALLRSLRPGGRFCFAVPMNELVAVGALPAFQPLAGVAGHVRVFTEAGLRERFGNLPDFSLTKLPGRWRPGRYPATIAPVEYGAFFVAVSAP
jgi:SAM-dependent methyltransferase